MDPIMNPFSPGAGCPPPALVGRDAVLEQARVLLARSLRGRAAQSMLMTGLRGVGKTVLLNRMASLAQKEGYHVIKLEIREGKSLADLLALPLRNLLYELDVMEGAHAAVRRALSALRNFIRTIRINIGDIGIGVEMTPGLADSGDLEMDLPTLLQLSAEAAGARGTGIALLVDEIQLLEAAELGAVVYAMHQLQQELSPLVLIAAGLPTLPRLVGQAKSYAERLFSYPVIDRLGKEDSWQALESPLFNEGATIEQAALQFIYEKTTGYPYFLQEWGAQVWNVASHQELTLQDALRAESLVMDNLDREFFRVRFDRLTDGEKRFMRAMSELGDDECRSADIAEILGVKPTSLTLTRANLIRKGMIYSMRHGYLRYSVPLFGCFLRRIMPLDKKVF